jgi:hypothetical protein
VSYSTDTCLSIRGTKEVWAIAFVPRCWRQRETKKVRTPRFVERRHLVADMVTFITRHTISHQLTPCSAWLRVTIDDGFPCYPCFNDDPNFSRIRFDSRFASMMSSLKEQWNRFASRYAM